MRKDSGGQNLILVLMVVGVLLVIGSIGVASEPKCIAVGCNNKQASGSSYCYLHKPSSAYTGIHLLVANPPNPATRNRLEAVIAATLLEVHQAVVLLIRAVQRKVLAIRRKLLMIPEMMVMTMVTMISIWMEITITTDTIEIVIMQTV